MPLEKTIVTLDFAFVSMIVPRAMMESPFLRLKMRPSLTHITSPSTLLTKNFPSRLFWRLVMAADAPDAVRSTKISVKTKGADASFMVDARVEVETARASRV